MEKKKLLYWFWSLVLTSGFVCADELEAIKQEIFAKAKREVKDLGVAMNNIEKNMKSVDSKMVNNIILKSKKEALQWKDAVHATKEKIKGEACKLQEAVGQAKINAKKFAESWALHKNDEMKETFRGYADLPSFKGVKPQETGMYIFVSLSMPKSLLLMLAKQAKKIEARLVIRGLKDNSFKKTIEYIHKLNKEGIKIDINPKVFERFQIKQVPSFVVTDAKRNQYDKMIGNVTVDYVLEEFVMQGDTSEVSLKYQQRKAINN